MQVGPSSKPPSSPHIPAPHPSLKTCRRFPISAMASKMSTWQTSSDGSKNTVGAAVGPAVGGPVGPTEGGPVGPAVGLSEGRAVGGPVVQTTGGAVGWVAGVVVGGCGSGLGRGPKKRHQVRHPLFLHTSGPMKYLLPKAYEFPAVTHFHTLDVGGCLPLTTGRGVLSYTQAIFGFHSSHIYPVPALIRPGWALEHKTGRKTPLPSTSQLERNIF